VARSFPVPLGSNVTAPRFPFRLPQSPFRIRHGGRPSPVGEVVAVTALYLALSVILTWPLAVRLADHGRVEADDGRWSIWNVGWVAHQLPRDPRRLFDANMFHPLPNTLAYSENNLVAGLMALPAYQLTKNALLGHNLVAFLSFVLTGVGGYYLARHLTGSRTAALVTGVALAFCPYRFSRLAHIQLLMMPWLPFGLLAFHRFVARQTTGRAIVLGVLIAVQGLSCGYYGIFLGLMVGTGAVFYAWSRGLWREPRYWARLALALLVAMGISLPLALPYVEMQLERGFVRDLDLARQFSADWRAYLASPARAHAFLLPYIAGFQKVLFPGFLLIGLAAFGFGRGIRAVHPHGTPVGTQPPLRETTVFYGLLMVFAFWSSFGPDGGLYAWTYHAVPAMSFLRAPARWGVVVLLCLAVFAAMAVATIRWRRPIRAGAVLVGLLALEYFAGPVFLTRMPPIPLAHRTLATLPAAPVAEFPFFHHRFEFPRHTIYMLLSTYHWRPLLNGYSDYIPPEFRELATVLGGPPDDEWIPTLRRHGIRYVVVHFDLYDREIEPEVARWFQKRREVFVPVVHGRKTLYEFVPPDSTAAADGAR
jgi:hypothetical protein